MKQFDGLNHEEMTMGDVLAMENFDLPSVNDVIEGEVVRVTNQEVTVDIHGATEGTIYLSELTLDKVDSAKEVIKVGDKIKEMIKKVDDEQILLSRRALLEYQRFQDLKVAFEKGETLEAKVGSYPEKVIEFASFLESTVAKYEYADQTLQNSVN